MRTALAIMLILICAAGSAEARRHRHHLRYYDALTPTDTETRSYGPRQSEPPAPEGRTQGRARIVPADWHEETADPQLKGQRFVSPDGSASFIAYAVPAGEEGPSAHMKAVAFGDGEQITYLRGERSWIAVAGFKQDRVFYRAAVLACAGDRWHHIAFDYPAPAKADMRAFIERATTAIRNSDNSSCDVPVISNQ